MIKYKKEFKINGKNNNLEGNLILKRILLKIKFF